jgi:hypothetical protein
MNASRKICKTHAVLKEMRGDIFKFSAIQTCAGHELQRRGHSLSRRVGTAGSFDNIMNAQKRLRSCSRRVFVRYVSKRHGFYIAAAIRVREAARPGCPPREASKPSKAATVEWAAAGHEEGVLESRLFFS